MDGIEAVCVGVEKTSPPGFTTSCSVAVQQEAGLSSGTLFLPRSCMWQRALVVHLNGTPWSRIVDDACPWYCLLRELRSMPSFTTRIQVKKRPAVTVVKMLCGFGFC